MAGFKQPIHLHTHLYHIKETQIKTIIQEKYTYQTRKKKTPVSKRTYHQKFQHPFHKNT